MAPTTLFYLNIAFFLLTVAFNVNSYFYIKRNRRRRISRLHTIDKEPEITDEEKRKWELHEQRSDLKRDICTLLEGGIWKDSPDSVSFKLRMVWLVDQAILLQESIDERLKQLNNE